MLPSISSLFFTMTKAATPVWAVAWHCRSCPILEEKKLVWCGPSFNKLVYIFFKGPPTCESNANHAFIMRPLYSNTQMAERVTASRSRFSFIVQHFQPFVNIHHHCLIHHYVNQMPPDITCTYYILHLCCQNWPNTFSISEQSDMLFCRLVCKGFQVDFKYS